jgi:hypothetical protein
VFPDREAFVTAMEEDEASFKDSIRPYLLRRTKVPCCTRRVPGLTLPRCSRLN